MREVKFRGFNKEQGWLYGCGVCEDSGDGTIPPRTWLLVNYPYRKSNIHNFEVEPKSVGQSTGLTDKNGKEIYEGDLYVTWEKRSIRQIFKRKGAFCGGMSFSESTPLDWEYDKELDQLVPDEFSMGIEVIGNVYENPELLGG